MLGADRIAKFVLAGDGTYSFDIVDGRIRAIYIMRNPDKLRGFLSAGSVVASSRSCRLGHQLPDALRLFTEPRRVGRRRIKDRRGLERLERAI
jgi:hypothetical protein